MEIVEQIIKEVLNMVKDKRYYYSQDRENEFATDCSRLIITAISRAGLPVNGATYTGNMVKELKATNNFQVLPFNYNKAVRGDIFVKHIKDNIGHTVIYLGGGQIAEACNKRYGLRTCNYYANNYQYILRCTKGGEKAVEDLPMLQKGSKNIYVGFLQLFLNKYCGCRLVIDCDFGSKTKDAVQSDLQLKHGLEVDGIVGVKTWGKIYSMMVQS